MLRDLAMEQLGPELNTIQDNDIRQFTLMAFQYVSEEFFYIPSSSSGKYHPVTDLGVGGNLRHTKNVFYIANNLCEALDIDMFHRDIVLSACLLHDVCKPSKEHPYLVRGIIGPFLQGIYPTIFEKVMLLIESHHGKWGKNPMKYKIQEILHMADYLASRKEIYIIK